MELKCNRNNHNHTKALYSQNTSTIYVLSRWFHFTLLLFLIIFRLPNDNLASYTFLIQIIDLILNWMQHSLVGLIVCVNSTIIEPLDHHDREEDICWASVQHLAYFWFAWGYEMSVDKIVSLSFSLIWCPWAACAAL